MSNGGLSQLLSDIFGLLGIQLPWWSGIVIGITVAIVFFPLFLKSTRAQRARKLLHRSGVEISGTKEMEDQAIEMVKNDSNALLSMASIAEKQKRYQLVARILNQIPNPQKYKKDIRKLRSKITPRGDLTPTSAAVAIEALLNEGLHKAAQNRFDIAIKRWPSAPELLTLQQSLRSVDLADVVEPEDPSHHPH